MEIIVRSRCTGKTLDLIEKVRKDPDGLLVVSDDRQALRLRHWIPEEKIMVFNPEKIHGIRKNVYIDNADLLLQNLMHQPIKAITLTKEE